jgi:hypothetical protein
MNDFEKAIFELNGGWPAVIGRVMFDTAKWFTIYQMTKTPRSEKILVWYDIAKDEIVIHWMLDALFYSLSNPLTDYELLGEL